MNSGPPAPNPASASIRKTRSLAAVRELGIRSLLFGCAAVSILTTLSIIYVLLVEAVWTPGSEEAFFEQISVADFLTGTRWEPAFREARFGILPLISGTLLITGIAAVIGLPLGLASAVYLSEYASPSARKIMKPTLEILAGVPTIVYGFFALFFITPYILRPVFETMGFDVNIFNALSGGIVVGIMIIPMVSSLSEDVLRSVPGSLRESAFALGSTKLEVSTRVVVPAALSGIIASFLLAIARAIGETMAVTIACGQSPNFTGNPLNSVQTMTSYIVNTTQGDTVAGSIEYKALYAVGLTLFLITLVMNIISQLVLRRFREVYN